MGSVKYRVPAESINGDADLSRLPDVILPSQFFELVCGELLISLGISNSPHTSKFVSNLN